MSITTRFRIFGDHEIRQNKAIRQRFGRYKPTVRDLGYFPVMLGNLTEIGGKTAALEEF